VCAVHREHWPISELEPRPTNLDGEAGRIKRTAKAGQVLKTRIPALAYKNKSSYDRF